VNGLLLLAHGDEVPPFTPAAVFSQTELFSIAALALVLTGWLYGYGVFRLTRAGHHWPIGRTIAFFVGLALIAVATVSGLAAYDDVLLSAHMSQHMLLAMVAPIFLALGAPVTLALRTLAPGARRVLLAFLHSGFARFFTFPIVSFALFIGSPFVLYFSGLYRLSLENDWVHELVHLHFLIVGCLFLWPLIGLDPLPGRLPYPLRALIMFLSTPFHTVLGLTVMQSANLLAGDWYPNLHLAWADPHADQQLAGGILWAGGELVSVTMLAALVVQWMRHAEREARRVDRALDRQEALEREALEREALALAGDGSAVRPPAVEPAGTGLAAAGDDTDNTGDVTLGTIDGHVSSREEPSEARPPQLASGT
jgi:putative copper resistance protein D